jgi:predicted DNA binding CopG/RHH family protein
MDKKKLEDLTADHERWDEHVATAENTRFLSDEEQREINREIDEGLGLQMISLRLNRSLIEQFKQLAKLERLGYQPLMRQVLAEYAKQNEHRLTALLSPSEAAARADKLFTQAMQLREQIPIMKPLSNERICAETDYSHALGQAQMLFVQAVNGSKDCVLTQHAKLRLAQIEEICKRDSHAPQHSKPLKGKAS